MKIQSHSADSASATVQSAAKQKQLAPSEQSIDQSLHQLDSIDQLIDQYDRTRFATDGSVAETRFLVRVVTTESEFDNLAEPWAAITSNPMRSFSWHRRWWTSLSDKGKLCIFCLEAAGEVVGIAPLFQDRWLGLSRLRFMGSGKTCTDYPDLIVAPKFRSAFVDALMPAIQKEDFDLVELEGLDHRGPAEDFKSKLGETHWSYEKATDSCWHFELPATWESFQKNCSKSLKRKVRKAEKRLASPEIKVRSTSDTLEFDEAFDHLVALHQTRFEAKGEPGVFADSKFQTFLRESTRELSAIGGAEINVSFANSKPLAAQLYLLDDDGPQFYQGGMQVDRMDLEPGHLMFTYAVKKAIARGDVAFDFLRGNEPYKPFWGASPRQLTTLRLVSRRPKATFVNHAFRFARKGKRRIASLQESISSGLAMASATLKRGWLRT